MATVAGFLLTFLGALQIDDVIEAGTGTPYVLECNWRVNGNCGASFLALGAGIAPAWGALNIAPTQNGTALGDYAQTLANRRIHYTPGRRAGVFVYNAAPATDHHKMHIGAVGDDLESVYWFLAGAYRLYG